MNLKKNCFLLLKLLKSFINFNRLDKLYNNRIFRQKHAKVVIICI